LINGRNQGGITLDKNKDKNIQNQANMMLNNLILEEQLPEMIKSLQLFAKASKGYYSALLQEGFSLEQATIMVTNWQNITFMQAKQQGE